jgi:SSS family solute:Na+ symporter
MYTEDFRDWSMFVAMIILLIFTYSRLGGVVSAHQQLRLFTNPAVQQKIERSVAGGFRGWARDARGRVSDVVGTRFHHVAGVGIGVLAQPSLWCAL